MFQIDPETLAAMQAWHGTNVRAQLEERQQQLKFAAILCTCPRRYDPNWLATPDQCMIHRRVTLNPLTGEWIY